MYRQIYRILISKQEQNLQWQNPQKVILGYLLVFIVALSELAA